MAFAIGLLKNIYGNISAQEIAGRFPSIPTKRENVETGIKILLGYWRNDFSEV